MMSYINETDFVIENKELVYPEIITDGLQLYYDAKGKRDTDYHRDTMLDMSGNKNHGKLHNFAYEKHSGYKDGLVFDYIDDKLVRPKLDLKPDDFTFMLNGNIISFSPDGTVKRVQDGEVIESKGFNILRNGDFSDGVTRWPTTLGDLQEGSGTAIFTPNRGASRITQNNEVEINHVYYHAMRVKATGSTPNIYPTNPTGTSESIKGNGEWEVVSVIHKPTGSPAEIRYVYNGTIGIPIEVDWIIRIDLTTAFGAGNEPTKEETDEIIQRFGFIPNAQDLIDRIEYKGNDLGDMENIIDGLYKTEVLSGEEIYTDNADDSVVHVEIDGKSVGGGSGKNLILNSDFQKEPLSYASRLTELKRGYNYFKFKTSPSANTGPMFVFSESLKSGVRYTLSFDIYSETGKPLNYITMRNGMSHSYAGSNGGSLPTQDLTAGWNTVSISVSGSTDNNGIWIGTKLLDEEEYIIKNLQLEEGSTATAYEPPAATPDYPIEIHSLNDFDVVSSVGKRNMIYKGLLEDGSFAWNTYAPNGGGNTTTNLNKRLRSYIPIEPSTNYYVSTNIKTTDGKRIEISCSMIDSTKTYVDGFGRMIETPNDFNGFVFKTAPNARLARFRFGNANSGNNLSFDNAKFVLVKSNTPVPYTPAPEDILESDNHPLIDKINLLLDEPLRSVGDVKDRVFRDSDGLWKVERNIGEIVFDGSEANYRDLGVFNSFQRFRFPNMAELKTGTLNIISSHFPMGGNYPRENNIYIHANEQGHLGAGVSHTLATNLNEFKQWLQKNNLNIYYELSNPQFETLDKKLQDKLNNLRSFQDSNYVYTIINDKTDILPNYVSGNLKPTLHAKFLYNNWYKEDRVVNNLMIYNRALTNEEMLQNYKTIKRRWGM